MKVISNTTPFIALAAVNQLAMNLNLTGLADLSGLNRHSLDTSKTSTADLGDTRIRRTCGFIRLSPKSAVLSGKK